MVFLCMRPEVVHEHTLRLTATLATVKAYSEVECCVRSLTRKPAFKSMRHIPFTWKQRAPFQPIADSDPVTA